MRIMRRMQARLGRYVILFLTVVVFTLLLVLDAQIVFTTRSAYVSFLSNTISFGFSVFITIAFLAIGTLVWLFARERRVALLLFCFTFTMMMTFTLQTGTLTGNPILSVISDVGAALALAFFAFLLLLFPNNFYAQLREQYRKSQGMSHPRRLNSFRLLQIYLLVVGILSVLTSIEIVNYYVFQPQSWLYSVTYFYYLVVLTGIIITMLASYRRISSRRERQQLRFFTIGVVAAFAPLLVLTVLPSILNEFGLPARYIVNSQISTATIILLPAALGYSILRYQILVFDMYIQRVVAWTVGVVFLAVVGYSVEVISVFFFSTNPNLHTALVVSALVVLSPLAWGLAHVATEKLFFNEMQHYRHLIEKPDKLMRETMNVDEVAELLTLAAVETFETQEACLFVFDRDSGCYRASPALRSGDAQDAARSRLARRLIESHEPSSTNQVYQSVAALQRVDWLDAGQQLIRNVENARRPLFLNEAVKPEDEQPTGLALYLSTSDVVSDPLLVPVRVQGKMIGMLMLGERGDQQQWAGPDFEVIDLLLARFSPLLENARLYEQASRHAAILNELYSANATLEKTYESIDEVVAAHAAIAAQAAKAGAEVWLMPEGVGGAQELRLACHAGQVGIHLGVCGVPSEQDWHAWFYEGSNPAAWNGASPAAPSCLAQASLTPCYPFAWLPLENGEQRFGILALMYSRPHLFSDEEKRLWVMFAAQCASAINIAQSDIALRDAYERQKELDQLKDQFIMTASHELRTPLTAVQGYIDLLLSYGEQLTPESRAEFVAKASRGCDELTLMVNNIMDASRVDIEVEQVQLRHIFLLDLITQVLEMMDALARREHRSMQVTIPADLCIMGDEQRLKQVILNLMGNAFKYSPQGSALEISAHVEQEQGILSIRDHGLGVPPQEQQRLFDRFMRLERDMNSPARGAGLGLFISKQLVEAMGGRIWVESSGIEGEGSTFAIALKLYLPAQVLVQ